MGTITTGTGLISGLDTKSIIDQLIAIDGKQKDLVQAKVDSANAQRAAYTQLSTRLTGLQITSQQIAKPSFFSNAAATSSDEDVMTATAGTGAAVGSYQFRVARLVQAEQLVSNNFGDPSTATLGTGKITVELGGGGLTQENNLSDLRGGLGIARGQVRVTDRGGHSSVIDLSDAVTLNDVVKKFNTSIDVSVKAGVVNGQLTLTDATGLPAGTLTVADVGGTTSAADLGIATASSAGTISGANLSAIGNATRLASLNDGNGVVDATGAADIQITSKAGTVYHVDLAGATTVGDALSAINKATSNKVTASLNADGTGLKLVDSSGGGGSLKVEAEGSASTAADLGILGTAAGAELDGTAVASGTGTVLLKTLNGGSGVTLGIVHIKGRGGGEADVDLSAAKSVQDVIDKINVSGVGVQAAINSAGNGLQLTDTTGGTGPIVVSDTGGTGAAQLGLAGTFDSTVSVVNGANLQRKWVSPSTTLADYNGGRGVRDGEFAVTAADGTKQLIDIDTSKDVTLGDVIAKINAAFKVGGRQKVTASVNAHGDGLMLTDNSGGAGTLTVEEKGGTTATSLNLVGKATAGVLDGAMEKTIDVGATDTLADVQKKINALSFGVSATILNDGSGANAYRLSLNATTAGRAGQISFDAGTTTLGTRQLVAAQDAAVFVGSGDAEPMLVTSSKNTVTGAVKGVTLNLTSVSSDAVTISVTNDVSNVKEALQTFTDNYNQLVTKIEAYTSFRQDNDTTDDAVTKDADGNDIDPNAGTTTTTDTEGNTYRRGILLGDFSVSQVSDRLDEMLQASVPGAGTYTSLAQIGLSIGQDGTLAFDTDKFDSAYAEDPDSVKSLFTTTSGAISNDTPLRYLNDGNGIATAGDDVDDFQATLRDGTKLKVSVGKVDTVGQVLSAINAAGQGKLHAELDTNYKLVLTDLTAGTTEGKIEQLNSSQFLTQMGIPSSMTENTYTSRKLVSNDPLASATGGIGVQFQQTIDALINPVNGLIPNQTSTIDTNITTLQGRISDLNDMLDQKRTRLENQFNNLEEVLSKLKTQQSSLSSIGSG